MTRSGAVIDWGKTAAFARWVSARPDVVARFAAAIAQEPYALEPDGESGARAPIAAVLTPAVYDEAAFAALHDDARRVLAATTRLACWMLAGEEGGELFAPFTPLEHAALSRSPTRMARVATARCDLFHDADGRPWLLEQNTTIPALQGYSDMIARAWVRGMGGEGGFVSNTDELLASLVAHWGRGPSPSIVVVSRRADPERPELLYLVDRFRDAGHRVRHAYGDEIGVDERGCPSVAGESFDILYRHIFSRRIEPTWPLYGLMVDPGPHAMVLNPVTGPLEVKAMLALLHEAASEPGLAAKWGLADDEVDAIARLVPWSRVLTPGHAAVTVERRRELVLKRSWDYGGKAVFIGEDQTPERWASLVADAVSSGETWVVQELIRTRMQKLLVLEPGATQPVEKEVYTDLSVYLSQGSEPCPTGGTVRASLGRIVNVAGGGALVPMISAARFAELVG